MRIAVIGTGVWGSKIADTVEQKYECIRIDINDSLDYKFDGAIIATPAETHHIIAADLLAKKIPIMVEKPVALDWETTKYLCKLSEDHNTVMHAGHILCFTPNTEWIKANYDIDNLRLLETRRLNWGSIPKHEVDLNLHLTVHDLGFIDYLKPEAIQDVSVTSYSTTANPNPDYVINTIRYETFTASLHAGWHYPTKTRTISLIGDNDNVHADDVTETLTRKRGGYKDRLTLTSEEVVVHKSDQTPLANEIDNFVDSIITNNHNARNGIAHIRRVYRNLEIIRNA